MASSLRSHTAGAFDQYLHDIHKLSLIASVTEEKALARRARAGDEAAAERLVTANLRFVISYVKRYQGHGLDLSELVAIGNEGLLKAVTRFDPDHGVKFISYAVWWVRQAVLKALAEQTRSVRIPLNQNAVLGRLSRVQTVLGQALGCDATDTELATALGDTSEHIRSARRMISTEVSLDAPVEQQEHGGGTVGDRVAGAGARDIEETTDAGLRRAFIHRLFQRYLTPREQRILSLYYGLEEDKDAMTLEQIGAILGVTRERVRQIRERAFEKLRNSADIQALQGYQGAA
jgi:RNA polymerase primary sigma factor